MRSTFKLLFYINKQKIKADGTTNIMGRITIDGKVAQYSTGLSILPTEWDSAIGRAKGNKEINSTLDDFVAKSKMVYKESVDSIGFVSAEIVKNGVIGRSQTKMTLLSLFDEHNSEYAKRVGIDRAKESLRHYYTTRKHLYNFMVSQYNIEDIQLRAIEMKFIIDFQFYLSTILRIKPITYNNQLIHLRKIVKLAIKQKSIPRDPFAGHRLETIMTNHRYLTTEQIQKIMSIELLNPQLCHTRDLFIFSVFTGLGRADMANLSKENIVKYADGSTWIHIERQKTGSQCDIKLIDIPLRIMKKYEGQGKGNKVFYVRFTNRINGDLKKIAKLCDLQINLTYYTARHSFATNCLNNNVPIETISKMMGHSNIRTTQIYAEITNQKVGQDFGALAEQTRNKYSLTHGDMPLRQCFNN